MREEFVNMANDKHNPDTKTKPTPQTTGFPVTADIRAGQLANIGERSFYALLDALQGPTDWLYEHIVIQKPGR